MCVYQSQRNVTTLLRALLSCTSLSYPGCAPLGLESLCATSTCGQVDVPVVVVLSFVDSHREAIGTAAVTSARCRLTRRRHFCVFFFSVPTPMFSIATMYVQHGLQH